MEELEASVMAAAAEDQRMRELCGEYSGHFHHHHDHLDDVDIGHYLNVDIVSGRATRLRRKLKKEMEKDEESYMEMFI